MDEPFKKIESDNHTVWVTQPNKLETFLERKETAFNVAKGKLTDSNGKIETVLQTAEAFGRGLFADYIKNGTKKWTMDKWIEPVIENIFNPMGSEATFTKITEKEVRFKLSKFELIKESNKSDVASLFTYGYIRGILLSAFPYGELIMETNTSDQKQSMIEFTFKTIADDVDIYEREKVKNFLMTDVNNLKNKND